MADELTLPLMPTDRNRPHKRVKLNDSSPVVSSDPPLFSSDDDPSAENYTSIRGRRKRNYLGPWFNQSPRESRELALNPNKRTLQRHIDSGVWLPSDGTDPDSDAEFSTRIQLPITPANSQQSGLARPNVTVNTPFRALQKVPAEELARQHVEKCLEDGNANIDLSQRDLYYLPNSYIKPLSTFVSIPSFSRGVEFQTLQPELRLYLSINSLERIPGEICNLQDLQVLTLRSNELLEMPAAIGKMRNLVELNVSCNKLHFLPFEILELLSRTSKIRSLQIHPNPLYEAEGVYEMTRASLLSPRTANNIRGLRVWNAARRRGAISASPGSHVAHQAWLSQWDVRYRCRSYVRFIDINGRLLKGPVLPQEQSLFVSTASSPIEPNDSTLQVPVAPVDDIPEQPHHLVRSNQLSNAPSLYELATRAYARSPHLAELSQYLGEEAPEHLSRLLKDASILREMEAGDRKCTICEKTFVIPRTEWLEWWEIGRSHPDVICLVDPPTPTENERDRVERLVPLMRRGCSWRCVPTNVVEEEEECDEDAPLEACG